MRVLDVGCGAGDVTLEVAALVGPTGSVVGVDEDTDVLAVAADRAARAGVTNVGFQRATVPDIRPGRPFDALVGRLILLNLDDPVEAVRRMSGLVRPGGLVSFQDFNVHRSRSVPAVLLHTRCMGWICDALLANGRSPNMGEQMSTILREAGLPVGHVSVTVPASGDPDSPEYASVARTVGRLGPAILEHGIATAEDIDPHTLEDRLRAEARAFGAVLYLPELVGVWTRLPDRERPAPGEGR